MPEERKLVTVLFADIVDSTAHGMAHDPEILRASLGRTFEALRAVLVAHGGTVEKFIGDAVMAVFGVPAAHDDDADRAVRAACALRERIAELNSGAPIPFELRVGVNTGEAVAGAGEGAEFLVTGAAVNAGARLQSAAAPSEILVGALTHRLTAGGVRFGDARTVEAKGIGALEAWPALELMSAVPEPHRGLGPISAPLIGRDRELRLLEDAFARIGESGAPGLITIFGPAGAGKSRLTSEFAQRIGRDRVRMGRCLPYGDGITFFPLQFILRAECGIELTDSHAAAVRKLESAAADSFEDKEEGRAVVARVATIAGLAQPREALPHVAEAELAEELNWGVRRFFERRALLRRLVLIFEDLHWAEPRLVELVENLAEWSRAPLLLLCLARPDFRDAHPTFGASAANATTITLTPLGPDDTRRLVATLLVKEALPESLRGDLVRQTEGNPLYVEEFLRTLIETGRVAERGGSWVAVGDLEHLDVPPTLVGLITARLDRVAPDVKRVLQHASLVGRLFSMSGLTAIAGEPVHAELLREAVRRDLLVEADERTIGEGHVYRFKHVLIREVAYSTVPKRERTRMHDNYARWLEESLGDRADEFADLIAFHAEQAFVLARALGQADLHALGARALDRLLAAAARARHRDDLGVARKLHERAASVADGFSADPRQRAEAHAFAAGMAYLYGVQGQGPEIDVALDYAHDLAGTLGSSEALVFLLVVAARRAARRGTTEEGIRLFSQAVDAARATGDAELLGDMMAERAWGLYLLAQFDGFRVGLLEARDYFARTGARRALPRCLQALGFLALWSGDFTTGRRYWEEMRSLSLQHSRYWEAMLGWNGSRDAHEIGDLEAGVRLGEAAMAAARESGHAGQIGQSGLHLGENLIEAGDAKRAREVLEEAIAVFEARHERGPLPEVHARFARACIRLGYLAAAREHIAAARRHLLPRDAESAQIIGLAAAELAAAEGDAGEADRLFRATIANVRGSGFENKLAQAQITYGRYLVAQGRCAEARPQLQAALSFYKDPLAFRRRAQIDELLAKCEVPA